VWLLALVLGGGWFLWQAMSPVIEVLNSAMARGDVEAVNRAVAEARLGYLPGLLAVFPLVMLASHTLFLMRWGATPGKLVTGISVRRLDRPGPLDADTAIRRAGFQAAAQALGNAPFVAMLGTLLIITDLVWPLPDDKNQALHDKVAKTVVVKGRAQR